MDKQALKLLPRGRSRVPNVRVVSERFTEAEAHSRKREILMAYPAATVRIEKTGESGKRK